MLSGELDYFQLYQLLPVNIQAKKMAFYTTVLLEFQNNVPFPVVFLHFCFINIVFHHPYVPHCFYRDPHHLLPCWNKRCQ